MKSLKNIKKNWQKSIFVIVTLFSSIVNAQDVRIEVARKKIQIQDFLQIRVLVSKEEIKTVEGFPEMKDFEKTFQVSLEYTNNKGEITQGIEQNYRPLKAGNFSIPSFDLKVNGKKYNFKGEDITVIDKEAENETHKNEKEDILAELEESSSQEISIGIGKLQEAFAAVTVSKNEVFVGEEVNVTYAFYLADNAARSLDLYQLNKQLSKIIRKIKLPKSWEEDYRLDSVTTEKIVIGKKKYQRFKFYQASFFPSEAGKYTIPSLDLQMEDKETEKIVNFRSEPVTITVKPFPYKTAYKVPVGRFQLQEAITYLKIQTGKTVDYQITILGNGNFATLSPLQPNINDSLEFYTPTTEQILRKAPNQLLGSKSFRYSILAKKAGKYPLKHHFRFVYFNTEKGELDTLYAKLTLEVSGEPVKDISVEADEFEAEMKKADNTLQSVGMNSRIRMIANIVLAVLVFLVLYRLITRDK